ncbi:MAG: HAMP domain-containing histidine kinase [Elusimicrobia bacterium]|nr:HAMP domain-containing histidine kinase [Elusimicrobiota bacterium]
MKIFYKLILALISIAFISSISLSLIFFKFQKNAVIKAETKKMEVIEQGIKNIMIESKLARDPLMIIDHLSGLISLHPEIDRIRINTAGKWVNIAGGEKRRQAGLDASFIEREVKHENTGVRIHYLADYIKSEQKKAFAEIAGNLTAAVLISAVICLLMALALSYPMAARISALSGQVQEIGAGKFGKTIPVAGSDEISTLARNFNIMSEKLMELEEMKKIFISSITHELRSPLGVIESYINLLLKNKPERENDEKETLARIRENAARLSNFVTTLLDISKIEKGKMELNLRAVMPVQLIQDVLQFFAPKIKEANLTLETEIEKNILEMRMDPELIGHVITNLVSNAVKFTPEAGKITVTAGIKEKNLKISVRDTGSGIPPDLTDKIFVPFEQGKIRGARPKGTGLGLALAKGIVELHGGKIGVNSAPGKGCEFWFEIPVRRGMQV